MKKFRREPHQERVTLATCVCRNLDGVTQSTKPSILGPSFELNGNIAGTDNECASRVR